LNKIGLKKLPGHLPGEFEIKGLETIFCSWEECVVRLRLRDNESVNDAVRRFRKLVEHSGVKKELRKREFYEKPSEQRRREKRRAKNRARMNQVMNG